MTEKHKLKKRARARKQAEGTTYSEALKKEREAKPVTPPKRMTLADLETLRGDGECLEEKLQELISDQFLLLKEEHTDASVEAFIDHVCAFAMEIYRGWSKWSGDSLWIHLMEAAAGIDRFWAWDPYDCSKERWGAWGELRQIFENDASPEAVRAVVTAAVRSGLEAPELQAERRSAPLTEKERLTLAPLWSVGPLLEDIFGGEPRAYSGGDPNEVETPSQDGVVVWTLQEWRAAKREGRNPLIENPDLRKRWADAFVQSMTQKSVDAIMRFHATGSRRGIAIALLELDEVRAPDLTFVQEVFAKIDEGIPDAALRSYLRVEIEPRVKTLLAQRR